MQSNSFFSFPPILLVAALTSSANLIASPILTSSQERSVLLDIFVQVPGDSRGAFDALAAPDFGPFDAEVAWSSTAKSDTSHAIGHASTSQSSAIGAKSIFAQLGAAIYVSRSPSVKEYTRVLNYSVSAFHVEFAVSTVCSFTLVGAVDTSITLTGGAPAPGHSSVVTFSELNPGGFSLGTINDGQVFAWNGVLMPGRYYSLQALSSVTADADLISEFSETIEATSKVDFRLDLRPQLVPEVGVNLGGVALLFGVLTAARRFIDAHVL